MNLKIIKSFIGLLGVVLGLALFFMTWRTGVGMALGSGIFGASFLALTVGVLGSLIAVLIMFNSFRFLLTLKETKDETN